MSQKSQSNRGRVLPGYRINPLSLALLATLSMSAAVAQAGDREPTLEERSASAMAPFSIADYGNRSRMPVARAFAPSTSAGSIRVAPAAGAVAPGTTDPASWMTDEFKADWGLEAINAHFAYARGLTGAGVTVANFDAGADLTHSELASSRITSINLGDQACAGTWSSVEYYPGCEGNRGDMPTLEQNDVYFNDGTGYGYYSYGSHGTHTLGTIAANRDGTGMHGVAFGANVAAARFFSDTFYEWVQAPNGTWRRDYVGSSGGATVPMWGELYDKLKAMNARAVNLEIWQPIADDKNNLAGVTEQYNGDKELFDLLAQRAVESGMIHVVAAGNDYGNIANIFPGLPVIKPELEPFWLAVTNLEKNADGSLSINDSSSICGYAANWCVSAPGTDINSSFISEDPVFGGTWTIESDGRWVFNTEAGERPAHEYRDLTGTSMAAPHAMGALALLLERYPYLTNTQVRDVLLTTATDLGDAGVDPIYGWGLIDLKKGIEGFGSLRVDTTVNMTSAAGGIKNWTDGAWDQWTNDIGGPGSLTKDGAGWLRLTGANTFNGLTVNAGQLQLTGNNNLTNDVVINNGTFALDGSLTGSDVTLNNGVFSLAGKMANGNIVANAGLVQVTGQATGNNTTIGTAATLTGTGTLGNTTVAGTISPGIGAGNIGTINIAGNYVQQASSTYRIDTQAPNLTDKINVTGTATLNGGSVVALTNGNYLLGQSYNILSAAGGLTGKFAGLNIAALNSPFIAFGLRYDPRNAYLDVARGISFASVGTTFNQTSTGAALDGMPLTHPLLQKVVYFSVPQALSAFDQLSGEAHATYRSLLMEDNRHLRNAALAQARTGQDLFTAQADRRHGWSLWADGIANSGHIDSDGNAAKGTYDGHSILAGVDYQGQSGWKIGMLVGGGESDLNIRDRGSRANVDNTMAGIYAGQTWGKFGLHGGYTQTNHRIKSERNVVITGIADHNVAKYDGRTKQAFVEGSLRFENEHGGVVPYVQYAQVRGETDAFKESGGITSLNGAEATTKTNIATAGVRLHKDLKAAGQTNTWLSLRGGVAYRQASGDRMGVNSMAFNDSDARYAVHGVTIPRNATIAEIGMAARVTKNSVLEAGYNGQFSSEGNDNGVSLRYSVKF